MSRSVRSATAVRRSLGRAMRRTAPELTGRAQATLDRLRPSLREGLGPFNDQQRRQEVVRDAFARIAFQVTVETGTYRGTTTEFLWREFGVPVYTIESNPRYYRYCSRRFRNHTGITTLRGDSREVLRSMARDPAITEQTTFFYLDAHCGDDLPLADEIRTVVTAWRRWMIMVDDFEVPEDPGYGFDDYGDGKRLCLEYLPRRELAGAAVFWPAVPAVAETGSPRGYVVLASEGGMADALSEVRGLRRGGSVSADSRAPVHR